MCAKLGANVQATYLRIPVKTVLPNENRHFKIGLDACWQREENAIHDHVQAIIVAEPPQQPKDLSVLVVPACSGDIMQRNAHFVTITSATGQFRRYSTRQCQQLVYKRNGSTVIAVLRQIVNAQSRELSDASVYVCGRDDLKRENTGTFKTPRTCRVANLT